MQANSSSSARRWCSATANEYLGAVGGRVLAEVLLGLLLADPTAYLHTKPRWQPILPAADGTFRLADLLTAAGVVGKRG